jgi:hypothetical protein
VYPEGLLSVYALRRLVLQLHQKNEELEMDVRSMQIKAQAINSAVAAKVKIFREVSFDSSFQTGCNLLTKSLCRLRLHAIL